MPDFFVHLPTGVTVTDWDDSAFAAVSGYSRTTARASLPHRHYVGTVGTEIVAMASLVAGGTPGPMDSELDGRLFSSDIGENSSDEFPSGPAGDSSRSSVQRFTPLAAGHFLWVIRHSGGGAVGFHLDVDEASI